MRSGSPWTSANLGFATTTSRMKWLNRLGGWAILIGLNRAFSQPALAPAAEPPLPTTLPTWIREGEQESSECGTSLGGGGDLNGDGFGDLVIGEPGFRSPEGHPFGRVLIFHGGPHGFGREPNQVLIGPEPGARFGAFLAVIGDVNGDRIADLAVGSPDFQGGLRQQGRVDVYLGSNPGLSPNPQWTRLGGMVEMGLGRVAAAGDVNSDGIADLLVSGEGGRLTLGAPGEAWIIAGSPTGLTQQVIWNRRGTQKGELYGDAAVSAGDVNGDGRPDLVVGSKWYDGREENEGRVQVFLGQGDQLLGEPSWTATHTSLRTPFRWSAAEQRFGSAVAPAGDLNADGLADLVVGGSHVANEDQNEGRAFVWFGSKAGLATAPDWTAEGNEIDGHFATAVAGVGDVNGDGVGDLLISGRTLDHGEVNEGVVALYHGSRRGLSRWPDWTAESNERGAELGTVVQPLGDANGDGLADFAVGARYHARDGRTVGEVRVYWGHRGGLPNGSGWRPELPPWERGRRWLDRLVAQAGATLVWGGLTGLLGLGIGILMLARARHRARVQVQSLRSRLHDFVGSEMAGSPAPGQRMPELTEELRATIWTVKQQSPTVVGLVGFLTDWAWRFANEQKVTLRLDLPKHALKPRTIDFDVAEAFQAFVRVAMTHAVDNLAARNLELRMDVSGRSLQVELRVWPAPAQDASGAPRDGEVGHDGTDPAGIRIKKLRTQIEAVEGRFELESDPDGQVRLRASSPLIPLRP